MSRLEDFKSLYMKWRREVLRLSYARNKGGATPFLAREIAKFRGEVEQPMDAAWAALPPTERQIFLAEDKILTRANSVKGSHK